MHRAISRNTAFIASLRYEEPATWVAGSVGRLRGPAGTSVFQLCGQCLDLLQIALGNLGQAFAVFGVGFVEVRQQVVTGFLVGLGQLATQGVDQVLLLLGGEGTEQLTGLLEVLRAVNRRLLSGARERQLAVEATLIFLAVQAAA